MIQSINQEELNKFNDLLTEHLSNLTEELQYYIHDQWFV
jgi:hypothetical protein